MTISVRQDRALRAPQEAFVNPLLGEARPDFLRDETLAEIFETTALHMPDKIAIIEGDRSLTYGAVNEEAERLAAGLVHQGARAGRVVGLWFPRGADLLIAQIAVAKTGAAWLPFDAETPPSRIAICLTDAEAIGLLTTEDLSKRASSVPCPIWVHNSKDVRVASGQRAPSARYRGCLSSDRCETIANWEGVPEVRVA